MSLAEILSLLGQIGLGGAAWRLANRVATRQEATDTKVGNHEARITRLEAR